MGFYSCQVMNGSNSISQVNLKNIQVLLHPNTEPIPTFISYLNHTHSALAQLDWDSSHATSIYFHLSPFMLQQYKIIQSNTQP